MFDDAFRRGLKFLVLTPIADCPNTGEFEYFDLTVLLIVWIPLPAHFVHEVKADSGCL